MLTEREQDVVRWLRQEKVATMQQIRQHFDISHMTVARALSKHGYCTSYNHNAKYYTLDGIPHFDDWGLWTFRDVHFSKHGTFKKTLATLVEQSPAGRTTRELNARLHADVGHTLSRLVKEGRLACQPLSGRQVVYLAADPQQQRQQFRRRQAEQVAPPPLGLPAGMAVEDVLAVLRQMIPEQWSRQLKAEHRNVSDAQVRQVIQHYALEKKRRS
jgi:hypothetical protein